MHLAKLFNFVVSVDVLDLVLNGKGRRNHRILLLQDDI